MIVKFEVKICQIVTQRLKIIAKMLSFTNYKQIQVKVTAKKVVTVK